MKKRTQKKRLHPDTVQMIKQILLGVAIFLLIAGILTGIWYGSRIQALTLSDVRVAGGETISHQRIEERVREQLDGTYLRLVPRTFAFTYPKADIYQALNDIERIKDVEIHRRGGTTLEISFGEFVSEALWCSDQNQCVFIDADGYAFSSAPALQGGAFIRYHTESDPVVGASIASVEDYDLTKELATRFSGIGFTIAKISLDAARDAYFEILGGGEFRVALDDKPDIILSNLETILQSEDFSDVAPGAFQYIDLRFGDKVFVNRTFQEENATTSEDVLEEETETEVATSTE